jgi:outer membrane protein
MIGTSTPRAVAVCAAICTFWAAVAAAQDQPPPAGTSLTLQQAIEIALGYHPSVGAARAMESEAASRVGEASAKWWPALNLDGSLMRFQEQMLVFPLHALDTSAFRFDRTLIQGNVSAGWTLWDGGARSARIKTAKANETVASLGNEATEMSVIADVTAGYLQVLSAKNTLEAEEQSLASLQAERDRIEQLLAEGRAARVELLRVEAAIAQAESERIATAATLEAAERSLARWLGVEPDYTVAERLTPVRLTSVSALVSRGDLVSQFEATNPDLAEAQQRTEAADWARRAAVSAWHPRLDIVGAYLLFSSPQFDVKGEWQAGVRLSYPLFTGGARSRAVSGASARRTVAEEQLRLTRLQGEETIDLALTAVSESRARADAVETAVQHLAEVARIEQLALEAGAGTQTDFLRADADLRGARARLIEARHMEILARIQLARTTGELSVEWLASTLETLQ